MHVGLSRFLKIQRLVKLVNFYSSHYTASTYVSVTRLRSLRRWDSESSRGGFAWISLAVRLKHRSALRFSVPGIQKVLLRRSRWNSPAWPFTPISSGSPGVTTTIGYGRAVLEKRTSLPQSRRGLRFVVVAHSLWMSNNCSRRCRKPASVTSMTTLIPSRVWLEKALGRVRTFARPEPPAGGCIIWWSASNMDLSPVRRALGGP